ncbi:MAG: GGDEF domain-containing protein, partial [Gammaproteobacteria bacterium]
FKLINDTYGHEIGDKVLQQVAHALRMNLRTSDNAARFAGDEFVVMLDHCASDDDALALANKLRRAIMEQVARLNLDVPLGVSIGVLWINSQDLVSTVLQKADKLMYQAKRKGRNFNQFGRASETSVNPARPVENPDA